MQTDLSTQPTSRLSDRTAFFLLASIIVGFLASSAAPTPLYSTYAAEWGFSAITTTVVFGVYALAVLAALLVFGRLSDHVGRRPVLLSALGIQAVATVVFATAGGVPELLAARVAQGLATGLAAGAIAAGLIDFGGARGAIANALSAPIGTGLGAIAAGLVVQFLPAPTHLIYIALLIVFAVQAAGVALMREPVRARPGAARSLVPRVALPVRARRALLVATPALVATWALPSYYASLGPALVRTLSGSESLLLGGVPLFLLALGAVPVILALKDVDPERVMLIGAGGIVLGVVLCLVAVDAGSTVGFLAATLVAGGGFGGAFQGAVRTVVPLAGEHERAGLLSIVYVVSYVALGVPAMIGGLLAVHNHDVIGTAVEYGVAVTVLAALAAAGLLRRRPEASREVDERCPVAA